MSFSSDLTAIKNLSDGVKNNKVTRFAYTQQAYTNNSVDGHADYDPTRGNNIPTADLSVIEVNPTVVDKGFRARASSLPRMLLNHLFGRISYNLNKVNDLFNELLVKVTANMGVANGLATLDANGRIPYSQLPEDAMEYQGEWNAQTNTPHLADGTGTRGDTYNVSVAGTQNLGSGSITFFVGDRVIYNENGVWQRLASGTIQSVCEILPDSDTVNVDLSKQSDITKILPMSFLNKLFQGNNARYWTQGTGSSTSYTVRRIACANGIWVVGTSEHGMWWSTDGKAWTQGTGDNTAKNMSAVVYANGLWIASSSNAGCWWSEDGKAWTQGTGTSMTTRGDVRAIIYANNMWLTGSLNLGCFWSTDGKTWQRGTSNGAYISYSMYAVAYANGLWVACSSSHGLWWSEDGKTWTQSSTASISSYTFRQAVFANGIWVAGSDDHGTWWSTDGKIWTQGTGGIISYSVTLMIYANGVWVAGGSSARIWWSTDGKTWTQGTGGITDIVRDIVYNNGIWVVGVGNQGVWWSTDGKAWTKGTNTGSNTIEKVMYANNMWVAGAISHGCWWSWGLTPELL